MFGFNLKSLRFIGVFLFFVDSSGVIGFSYFLVIIFVDGFLHFYFPPKSPSHWWLFWSLFPLISAYFRLLRRYFFWAHQAFSPLFSPPWVFFKKATLVRPADWQTSIRPRVSNIHLMNQLSFANFFRKVCFLFTSRKKYFVTNRRMVGCC